MRISEIVDSIYISETRTLKSDGSGGRTTITLCLVGNQGDRHVCCFSAQPDRVFHSENAARHSIERSLEIRCQQ